MYGSACGLTRSRTHTYAELDGMTRRLFRGLGFFLLGSLIVGSIILFCHAHLVDEWATVATSALGSTHRPFPTSARQRALSHCRNHGELSASRSPITEFHNYPEHRSLQNSGPPYVLLSLVAFGRHRGVP